MLTVEILKQNASLASVSDEVLAAIAEMSKNDENTVIGARIGALHGQYDSDIFEVTGIKKNDGEKSYDYAKRVLGNYKQSLETSNTKIAELQSQIETQKGNETLAQQLKDSKAQVSQLQATLASKDSELSAKQQEFDKALMNAHLDYAFKEVLSELKFKEGITESIQSALMSAAKAEVLAKGTPELVNGSIVLRSTDGNLLNNPNNGLNPYTIKELVMETAIKDALEVGRKQKGGGTKGDGGKRETSLLDLSGVKTQVEADKIIANHLMSLGLTRDSREFADKSMQLRAENNVGKLPIR